MTEIERLRKALEFYANTDNYWSTPMSLLENHDRRTLRAAREAEKGNKVLVDNGKIAKDALKGATT